MRIWTVIRESARAYVNNFTDLMLAFLLQGVLRAMCLTPLLFLLSAEFSYLAWLCVPMFLLIALPARQNYAIAVNDMLSGGRVLSPRLLSVEDYGYKLFRGLLGVLKMLIWMIPALFSAVILVQIYKAEGRLTGMLMARMGVDRMDGFSVLRWFEKMGEDYADGFIHLLTAMAASCIPAMIGCAWHCGVRHAAALREKRCIRGCRLRLVLVWVLSLLVFLPFVAVTAMALQSVMRLTPDELMQGLVFHADVLPDLGERLYLLAAAFVILFIPAIPLKQLMPAVAVHQQLLKKNKETETDAET